MSKRVWLSGKERNAIRAQLRAAVKAGKLEVRRTYYDYYDSCHAPIETPDAPWVRVEAGDERWLRDLKAGGPSITLNTEKDVIELLTGYSHYDVRVTK